MSAKAGATQKGNQIIPALSKAGSYFLEGNLTTSQGLSLDRKRVPFAVGAAGLRLITQTTQKSYPLGQKVTLQGTLYNTGKSTASNIALQVAGSDGKVLYQKLGLSITAGSKHSFTVDWTPAKPGGYILLVTASSGKEKLTTDVPFSVSGAILSYRTQVPEIAADSPFTIEVTLSNEGKAVGNIELTLQQDTIPFVRQVAVPAGGSTIVTFSVSIRKDTTFTLTLDGDRKATKTFKVSFGLKALLLPKPPTYAEKGVVAIPYTLTSAGTVGGTYPVNFTLPNADLDLQNRAVNVTHYLPAVIKGKPAPTISGVIHLSLPLGKHTVQYSTYGKSGSFVIQVEEAQATIALTAASVFKANQEVSLPFLLASKARFTNMFQVYFTLSRGTNVVEQSDREISLRPMNTTGSQHKGRKRFPSLIPGTYELAVLVKPGTAKVTHTFRVVPQVAISLQAKPGKIQSTNYVFHATITNQGTASFSGKLQVDAGFAKLRQNVTVAAGKSIQVALSLPLREAPVGKRTILLRLMDNAGQAIANHTLTFDRPAPKLLVQASPGTPSFPAGSTATLRYTCKNQGLFAQTIHLAVQVLGHRYTVKTTVLPKQSNVVRVQFALPVDLEELKYPAVYRWKAGKDVVVLPGAVGLTHFQVTGLKVSATASFDKRVYKIGEKAKLTLKVRTSGKIAKFKATIRIRYGLYEERRELELSQQQSTFVFTVPLGTMKHRNLLFQVLSWKGRSLLIDTLLVHRRTDPVWVQSNKDVYKPGEEVVYILTATADASVEVGALEYFQPPALRKTFKLKKGQSHKGSFRLPQDIIGGTYHIEYTVAKVTYHYDFNVEGSIVKSKSLTLDQMVYRAGDVVQAELLLESRANVDVEAVFSFLESGGTLRSTGVISRASLKKGTSLILSKILVPSTKLGGMTLLAEVYPKGNRRQSLGRAMARFDMGDFQLRAIRPAQSSFLLGSKNTVLWADLYAAHKVEGTLVVKVEGVAIYTKAHSIDGVISLPIPVPSKQLPRLGSYLLEAEYTVAGESSRAIGMLNISDTAAPLIEVEGVKDGQHYKDTVRPVVRILGTHIAKHATSIALNGQPFASASPVQEEKSHTLYVEAADIRGKKATKKLVFTIDRTLPQIQIKKTRQEGFNQPVIPQITVTDKYFAGMTLKLDGNSYKKGTPITSVGRHQLQVEAWDKAGNRSKKSVAFEVLGDEKLILTVTEPQSQESFSSPLVKVKGEIEPSNAKVFINGHPVTSTTQGSFWGTAHLALCKGEIEVSAHLGAIKAQKKLPFHLVGSHVVPRSLRRLHSFDVAISGLVISGKAIWVSLAKEGQILQAEFRDGKLGAWKTVTKDVEEPGALALSPKGGLLVIDQKNGKLLRVDAQGKVSVLGKPIPGMHRVTSSPEGKVWVISKQRPGIHQLNGADWKKSDYMV